MAEITSTEASLRSEPEWQKAQFPRGAGFAFTLKKICRPRSAAGESGAAVGLVRNRSKGVSSETSVASYAWTASPKKSEKLYSRRVNSWVAGLLSRWLTTAVVPSSATWMNRGEAHHFSWKARRIRAS